jgi:hypothetical protein
MISSSPERHTFQAEAYIKRCEEEGTEPSEDYLNLYKSYKQQDKEKIVDKTYMPLCATMTSLRTTLYLY